ncbi:MAG TPA: CPBP family intramembrane metalloprotease domain-containing protein [Flavobacterium sp.]|nr:CPBP family intramembrane metalloprotease domain-containing protein [Flavobacterium sp.]HAT76946.1 CPBP family intramembrane metalloprotease domain-containing protein [Flavobacterium sp.]
MYIEQAFKGNNSWISNLIPMLCIAVFFGLNFMVSEEQIEKMNQSMRQMPNNEALILGLLPFAFLLGLLFLLFRSWHQRSLLSLTTSREKVDYKRIFFSFSLIVLLTVIGFLFSYFFDNSNMVWNFNLSKFSLLFLISLLLFPFQIGFEEYLFRGYLMQQIGVIVKNRWFPLLFTSIVFGLMHFANPEVAHLGYGVMVFYIGTGFLLGIMTLMDESLELALGCHLGNNLIAALLITSNYSAIQTDSIFKYSGVENPTAILIEMIISIAIVYPIILYIFAKRYNWTNWKAKLTGKVHLQIKKYDTQANASNNL